MRKLSVNALVPVALLVAMTAACSKSNTGSVASPTAPSTTTSPAPVVGGASITGTVVTGASTAALTDVPAFFGLASAGRVTVSVNGTSISVISDDSGNFNLQNVPPGTLTLTISGTGFTSQVTLPTVGTNDQLRITVRVNGGSASLDDQELVSSDNKAEIEGQISSVSGLTSSGGTIVVGRMNSSVVVNGSTSITKGGTVLKPNDLTVGLRVHVRANRSGGTLTATTIIVQTSNPGSDGNKGKGQDTEDDDSNEAELSGVIADTPTGGCPTSNSFTVGTTKVVTNASTKFDNTTCANLAKGDSVSVEGTKQTDGSILAKEVEKKNGSGSNSGSGKTTITGTMSGLSGSCPALTFTVAGKTVKTDASTKYDDGLTCATMSSVPSTTQLQVEGAQSNGSLLASEIGKK